jgi:hypothetical protein
MAEMEQRQLLVVVTHKPLGMAALVLEEVAVL